ncbi:nucleotide exchange factor GrpE [Actinomyces gerencseriae]|uniref:nucleotide exchange factor GrpE n=1 Tax=Actinomyces gerencseriae TaxID=52769 RepID=UPI000405B1A2|nr:nucleotide exchange factor GrpE [Actinomyces gerencseriae]
MSAGDADREDGEGRIDPALADAVESAFDDVVLDESGDPVAPSGAAGEAGGAERPSADDEDGTRSAGSSEADDGAAGPGGAGAADSSEAAGSSEPSEASTLEQVRAEAARAADNLARARADLYNLQQEYQGFVRRSREGAAGHRETGQAAVVEALIPVLDEIELARQHGDLTGTFETTAGKLEAILADKFGVVRFGEAGEAFDPTIHEALMATESEEVSEPTIALVLQPGYRLGERVVRAARVQVANPA